MRRNLVLISPQEEAKSLASDNLLEPLLFRAKLKPNRRKPTGRRQRILAELAGPLCLADVFVPDCGILLNVVGEQRDALF